MDIALLPGISQSWHRWRIVTRIAGGSRRRKPARLTIHVERYNPALRLYRRLGFEPVGETGVYLPAGVVERRPTEKPASAQVKIAS
ncbi:MAG: hypothetical protein MZW92_09465 [Comamonadaceae bacterium]|nr:hypothetical protein [Comamonadaceae bacterium]